MTFVPMLRMDGVQIALGVLKSYIVTALKFMSDWVEAG